VRNAGSGIVGKGVIDGQGGEPIVGQTQSWWELTGSTGGNSANPALVETLGATNFTMYGITLHNSPKFHVKLDANGFVIWGVTIKTPSAAANSQGTALTPSGAHNTDGIDPGETVSNGYIVYNEISDGDDQIAIKGSSSAHDIVIAHNHFLAGHGMSIGSETNGGVHGIRVCDLSIDGTMIGMAGSSNGIRIKSNPGLGGLVTDVTYTDVCVRGVTSPIVLTPFYASGTGSIPDYTGITIRDFHSVGTSPTPKVTIDGYDMAHVTGLTLDNVVFDAPPTVTAQFADVTIGPGGASFTPMGNGVTVTEDPADAGAPNPCTGKWVSF
jgi:polygalacturonase